MSDVDDHEAQSPGEWRHDTHPWLGTSRWLRRTYPSFAGRRARLLDAIVAALPPGLAGPAAAIAKDVLSEPPGAIGGQLALAAARLAEIRGAGDDAALQLTHCLIAALDAHSRFISDNPALTGVQAAGWTLVPRTFAAIVVELALTLRQWREATMTGSVEEIRAGREPVDLEVQATALVTEAVRRAGAPPALAWLRGQQTADDGPGARTFAPANHYLFALIRVIPADEPAIVALYAAYAVLCPPDEARVVEDAALSILRRCGAPIGDALLSATVRAWTRGVERVAPLAETAFAAMPADDGAGRTFAACLAGLDRRPDELLAAHAWLTTASALCEDEDVRLQAGLLGQLAALADRLGDEVGARRARVKLAELGMVPAPRRPTPPPPDLPGPHADFDVRASRRSLAEEDLKAGYREFSEAMAELLERRSQAEAIDVLAACLLVFEEERRLAETPGDSPVAVAATLTSWTCAALADLYEAAGDTPRYEAYKQRQLELEDAGAAQEISGDGMSEWISICLGVDRLDRSQHCLEQAQAAFAAGRTAHARFWMTRAQFYRGAADEP